MNDKFFLTMVVLGAAGGILSAIFNAIPSFEDFNPPAVFFFTFDSICLICLYISYKRHDKNVMKGMIGAVLTALLLDCTCWLDTYFGPDTIFSCTLFVLKVIIFVNHFIINKEHHSMPINIRINQIVLVVWCLVCIAWDAVWAFSFPLGKDTFGAVVECCYCIGAFVSIVCIETRLDAYRIEREKAGWTEEKGYPEGYIHAHDRTK